MHILVLIIGLDKSTRVTDLEDRIRQFGLVPIRIPAVDGRTAALDEDIARSDPKAGRLLYGAEISSTQIACALSHRLSYETFLHSEAEWALVLEDDAFLADRLAPLLAALVHCPGKEPTIVSCFTQGRVNAGKRILRLSPHLVLQRLATYPGGTVAYLINRSAATLALNTSPVVASRADWPPWSVSVSFWRTLPNVAEHGSPQGELVSTIVSSSPAETPFSKAIRWSKLVSGYGYLVLRRHYPGGFRQYFRHAVLPSLLYWTHLFRR
jgi:hypothetical protein